MSTAKQVLARMMDRSGNTLMLAMETVPDDEFYAQLATGFSAAWTIGHVTCFADLFTSWFSKEMIFDAQFHHVFNDTDVTEESSISKAEAVDPARYPKKLLLFRFRQAWTRALSALDEFDDDQWDAPGPSCIPVSLLTAGAVWEHLAVHVYWHCGELAGSMPRFFGTYPLNILPHYFYRP